MKTNKTAKGFRSQQPATAVRQDGYVFCLGPDQWGFKLGNKIDISWASRGPALAGLAVARRRAGLVGGAS